MTTLSTYNVPKCYSMIVLYDHHMSPFHDTTTTTITTTTQCKLQFVHAVYAPVRLGTRPPVQVAEGNHPESKWSVCASSWKEKHHQRKLLMVRGLAPASIDMQWGTTMNASTVLVLVKRHKLEQDSFAQLALGH